MNLAKHIPLASQFWDGLSQHLINPSQRPGPLKGESIDLTVVSLRNADGRGRRAAGLVLADCYSHDMDSMVIVKAASC